MIVKDNFPKEGDLYKIIVLDGHTIELRYGYYADFERQSGEPVIIYPDLIKNPLYTNDGKPLVTAVQDTCEYYTGPKYSQKEFCCSDCTHYDSTNLEIGMCQHHSKRKSSSLT